MSWAGWTATGIAGTALLFLLMWWGLRWGYQKVSDADVEGYERLEADLRADRPDDDPPDEVAR